MSKYIFFILMMFSFNCFCKDIPSNQSPESISTNALQNFDVNPAKVKVLLRRALELAGQNIGYQYGHADPPHGSMDCSGTVYYLLNQLGIHEIPRSSELQYMWVKTKGNFHATSGDSFNSKEFTFLKPGDLLFWSGTYAIQRQINVTHVMIYLGKNSAGDLLMVGASNGRTYKKRKIYGVSVFDFQLPKKGDKSRFLGYSCIPGINCTNK